MDAVAGHLVRGVTIRLDAAERIRAAVAERPFVTHDSYPGVSMTVSVGVAGETGGPIAPDTLEDLTAAIERAAANDIDYTPRNKPAGTFLTERYSAS